MLVSQFKEYLKGLKDDEQILVYAYDRQSVSEDLEMCEETTAPLPTEVWNRVVARGEHKSWEGELYDIIWEHCLRYLKEQKNEKSKDV